MDNRRLHTLLVGDDENDYFVLRDLLVEIEDPSFKLEWVTTYEAALAAMSHNQHDLFLINYSLGNHNGLELLREAARNGCPAPLILITDQADRQMDLAALKAGAAGCLVIDQLNSSQLNSSIRYAIERKRAAVGLRHYREAQHHTRELAVFGEAGRVVGSALDLDTILEQLIDQIKTLLRTEGVSVLLHEMASDELVFAAVVAPDPKPVIGTRLPLSAGIAGWVMRRRLSVLLNDAQHDPRFLDRIDTIPGLTTHSLLATPLILKERVIGVIEVINKANGGFNQHDVEILEALTGSAAIAIENAQLYDEVERRAQQMTTLRELDRAITASLRPADVYHNFSLHAARQFPYDWLAITLLAEDELRLIYVTGEDKNALPVETTLPRKNSVAGWVVKLGQPMLRHSITTDTGFADDEQLAGRGIQSSLIIPLRVKGRIIGTWNLGSRQKGAYRADDLKMAQSMADQLAIAIENARLFEQVRAGREQMRRLAQQVVSAQEEERQRLSHELHDEAGQVLTALKIGLELIQEDLPVGDKVLRERLGVAVALTDVTMDRLRKLAKDLRPPALDTAGLNATLEGLCRDFLRWTQLLIDYTGMDLATLPDPVNICLYRFLQEALTNVAKHAQATHVWVKLHSKTNTISLTVEDNGRGFDRQANSAIPARSKGIGLLGMQERLELLDGWLEVETSPGHGTRVIAHIPIEEG